ncbi:MAG: glycoside hydrolase family 127 protein [Candidatus Nealsonbacteria bacterium]|nr:glycoside hydrolase family 127 protein [Candidatus Nealsonbacteria bacterium]
MRNETYSYIVSAIALLVGVGFCNLTYGQQLNEDNSFRAGDWPATIAKVQPVPLNKTQVSGYLGKRIDRNLESLMLGLETPIPKGFETAAAGEEPPKYRLAADSDFYKWLEGACYVFFRTGNVELKKEIDRLVDLVIACQDDDGYINAQKNQKKRWDPKVMHDLYIAGHLYEAAAAHYRATGEKRLLDAASRWADYQIQEYKNGNTYFKTTALKEHSEYELGLLRLYRATGNKRYLDFSFTLTKELCKVDGPTMNQVKAGGGRHAVRVGYLLTGMADLYLETGREDMLEHLPGLWDYINDTSMYVTGAVGSHGEHYSKWPYDLPHERKDHNDRHLGETCAAVANIMFSWRMHAINPQSTYFDTIEKTLYNHYLGSVALNGKGAFYYNPMRMVGDLSKKSDHNSKPINARCMLPKLNRTTCCMSNCWRFLGALPEYLYSYDDDGLFVNLYSSSTTSQTLRDGRKIELTVETEYPFDGKVTLRFDGEKAAPFNLRLRIPGWCTNANASWPGQEKKTIESGQYLAIERTWKKGDTVELQLDMPVRMIEPHPKVTANAGQVVFARGPLVYCLESEDVSFPVEKAVIAAMTPEEVTDHVTAEWHPDLLEGIHKLTVPGLVDDKEVDLVLVPWFVRASRSNEGRWVIHLPLKSR